MTQSGLTRKERIEQILSEVGSGAEHRKNAATRYIQRSASIFPATYRGESIPTPKSVQLEITNHCTTDCQMCKRWVWVQDKGYIRELELSTERQIALLQELANAGVNTTLWTGGEPMTHKELERLLEAAKVAGLHVAILSNGVGITETRAQALVNNAKWLRISMDDAPNTDTRPVRRVNGKNDDGKTVAQDDDIRSKVMASLENLRAAKQQNPDSSFRVGLAYTIQQSNVYNVPEMVNWVSTSKLARELGLTVDFKMAHGEGKYLCNEEQIRWLQCEVVANPGLVNNLQANFQYLRDFFFRRLPLTDIVRGLPTMTYYREKKTICFTPYLYSLIDAFGDVAVCCHLYDDNGPFQSKLRKTHLVGNVANQPFMDVWRSASYNQKRKELMPIDVNNTPCGICTRHWIPNTLLTRLYEEVFLPLVEEHGFEQAVTEYEDLLRDYPEEVEVWF